MHTVTRKEVMQFATYEMNICEPSELNDYMAIHISLHMHETAIYEMQVSLNISFPLHLGQLSHALLELRRAYTHKL